MARIIQMKMTGLIVLLLATLTAAAAQTGEGRTVCRNPIRVFSGHATVDLTPLFQWWTQQEEMMATNHNVEMNSETERPLPAWRRVTGTKVAMTGASWVVDAAIYTSPMVRTNERIILNNPPAVEEQNYYALKTQLADAEQQIANARRIYEANTNAEQKAWERVEMYHHSLSKVASTGINQYSRIAEQRHATAVSALDQLDQLEATRNELEKHLKAIPSAHGIYRVDWFAVFLGRNKQGVAIYDLGLVVANPRQ